MRPSDEDREAFELLGLSPDATVDEIRRAYQQLARTLAPGSLTLYSVLEPHEQHDLQRRLHAAYRHLLQRAGAGEGDEHRPGPPAGSARPTPAEARSRKRAARRLAVAPASAPPPSDAQPGADALPATEVPSPVETPEPPGVPAGPPDSASGQAPAAEEEFSGPGLRARREAAGITLAELSRRTRIRGAMIESVEAEAYGQLPPRVYLRGFVLALARELKLDGERVWRDYERRWQAATTGGAT